MIEFLSNNHQLITSFSAIFISLMTLVVIILQLKSAQKHQELSVFPDVCVDINFNRDMKNNIEKMEVLLVNKGLGPALIKYIRIKINDQYVTNWRELINTYKSLMHNSNIPVTSITVTRIKQGDMVFSLGVNSETILVELESKKVENEASIIDFIINNYDKYPIDIEIFYASIYQKHWIKIKDKIQVIKLKDTDEVKNIFRGDDAAISY